MQIVKWSCDFPIRKSIARDVTYMLVQCHLFRVLKCIKVTLRRNCLKCEYILEQILNGE